MTPLAPRSVVLSLLLILGAPCAAVAQVVPSANVRTTFWGFAALGIGAASDSTFYAAGSGAAVQFRKLVLLGRIASVGPKKENRMEDLGLLAGIGTRPGRVHVAVAAGLGVAHNSRDTSALALPLEAQVTWRFSHVVGLGLRGFLSVNRIATFGGLTLHVQVGRLR